MINKYTYYLLELIKQIAIAAAENNKKYFIGSGWAIDLSIGKITRNHEDVDFHPDLQDLEWWKDWLIKKNLVCFSRNKLQNNKDYPDVYKFFSRKLVPVLDLWPFLIKDNQLYINYRETFILAKQNWSKVLNIEFDNIKIYIENPLLVIEYKANQYRNGDLVLRDKDLHDFKMMGVTHPYESEKSS